MIRDRLPETWAEVFPVTNHLRMNHSFPLGAAALMLAFVPAFLYGVRSESVVHQTYSDFHEGELMNVSLHRDGRLTLAPGVSEIASMADTIIWSVAEGPDGSVFIGAGNEGRVYRLSSDGEMEDLFTTEEVLVRAMAVDGDGHLYIGTSPEGKVYRYAGEEELEVFFDPGEPYIWSLLFDGEGNLYVATGDEGRIYRVPAGAEAGSEAEVYFDSDESHISTLVWDRQERLLAGTSPNGYVFRMEQAGAAFLLFNSPDEEVRTVLPGEEGEIFVATFSSGTGSQGSSTVSRAMASLAPEAAEKDEDKDGKGETQAGASNGQASGSSSQRPGTIYRVDADGFWEPFWRLSDVAIHSLLKLEEGPLLIGTGDEGRVFSLAGFQSWKLRQTMPTGSEISALLQLPGTTDLLAFTSNPARIFRLDFGLSSEGEFVSKVFDAEQVAHWGRLYLDTGEAGPGGVEAAVRSGNTEEADATWTAWQTVSPEGTGGVTPARYYQYRIALSDPQTEVRRVRFFYRHANAAPVIPALRIVTANLGLERFELPPQTPSVDLDQLVRTPPSPGVHSREPRHQIRAFEGPGMVTVAWQARDSNQDELVFTVNLRPAGTEGWHTIGDEIRETFFSFSGNGLADGHYQAQVVASDRLSNASGEAREARRVSELFLIDNTAPEIDAIQVTVDQAAANIGFRVLDESSIVLAADYVLNGQEPVAIFPEDRLFDAREESFDLRLERLTPGGHTLLVRVTDEAGNTRVHQVAVEVGD